MFLGRVFEQLYNVANLVKENIALKKLTIGKCTSLYDFHASKMMVRSKNTTHKGWWWIKTPAMHSSISVLWLTAKARHCIFTSLLSCSETIPNSQLIKYTCVIQYSRGNRERMWKGDLHHSRTEGPHQVVQPPASTIFSTPYKIPILISLNQLHSTLLRVENKAYITYSP